MVCFNRSARLEFVVVEKKEHEADSVIGQKGLDLLFPGWREVFRDQPVCIINSRMTVQYSLRIKR